MDHTEFDDAVGFLEFVVDVAGRQGPIECHIGSQFRMRQRRIFLKRLFGLAHDGQRVVIDFDQVQRIARHVAVLCDDDRDGMPNEINAIRRQHRVLWRFQTFDIAFNQFIGLAADGTIYTSDGFGTYALSPAGELRWVSQEAHADSFGGRPISLGADGTIYTGVDFVGNQYAAVIALNPDGSVRWRFFPGVQGDLIIGPNVGPDGNIYGVQDTTFGGIGAFKVAASERPSTRRVSAGSTTPSSHRRADA